MLPAGPAALQLTRIALAKTENRKPKTGNLLMDNEPQQHRKNQP
jgi:hypothetical protein